MEEQEADSELRQDERYTYVDITIGLNLGLCARPSMALVERCNVYSGEVTLQKEGESDRRDGKSIMQTLMLGAAKGTKLEIRIEGVDEPARQLAGELRDALNSPDSLSLVYFRGKLFF